MKKLVLLLSFPGILFLTGCPEVTVTETTEFKVVTEVEVREADGGAQTISLFNGVDLSGWHVDVPAIDNDPDLVGPFSVKEGILVDLGDPRGHLITDEVFSDYRLEVEYRFTGKGGNGGVLVHSSTPRALSNMFPQSLEVQLESTNAGDFWCIHEDITVDEMEKYRGPKENWGVGAGKTRRVKKFADNAEKELGEWNTMVVEALDDKIKVWVNGVLVNYGYDCTATEGQIALQAEGTAMEFRRIELTPITELSE